MRAYLDEFGIEGDERRSVFAGIRACESATLEEWAQQRERNNEQQQAARST